MSRSRLPIPQDELRRFCQRHHIRRLSLFGSVLRDDFGPDSDVDVLVEFDPEHVPGWEVIDMQDELSEILGRRVDLLTFKAISRWVRDEVLASAEEQYVEE
jgi:predicted nucleotidyltransferase